MIVQERIPPENPGGWTMIKTYSDIGMMIKQDETGVLFSEAIDPEQTHRTYTETNIPIDSPIDCDEEELLEDNGF